MKYKSQLPTFIWRSNFGSYLCIIPNNNVYTSNSPQNITVKYRSQWSIFILRSNVRSYWTIIRNCHVHTSNSLQDRGEITEPWNIGHSDLLLFWSQTSGHTERLSQTVMFIHQIIFKISSKITEPWNIGHNNLLLFWGQTSGQTEPLSQTVMFIHQIVFKI